MTPFVWKVKLEGNLSLDRAKEKVKGKCYTCGRPVSRRRKFCSNKCRQAYYRFEASRRIIMDMDWETPLGTIYIRPKLPNETWWNYHLYLEKIKRCVGIWQG